MHGYRLKFSTENVNMKENNFKIIYLSETLNKLGFKPLKDLADKYGGWPLLNPTRDISPGSNLDLVSAFRRNENLPMLFSPFVDQNITNNDKQIVYVSQILNSLQVNNIRALNI